MRKDHPDLVQRWEDKQRRRDEESQAGEQAKAHREPRDALLSDRERQGVRTPPETQYDITIGNPTRTKLIIERRPMDPELDTVAGNKHTLQARRPPAHRAPGRLGHLQGLVGMGPLQDGPECVCVLMMRGARALPWYPLGVLASWPSGRPQPSGRVELRWRGRWRR